MGINETREITAVLMTVSKNFGMHSHVYESIWFKVGMMIDTIELYILILTLLILTLIQGHRSTKKKKVLFQLSHKVFTLFGWNLAYC